MTILKKWWFWLIVVLVTICVIGSSGSEEEKKTSAFDSAIEVDIMNGSGTEKIGEYSVLKMNSTDVTDEFLNDWYFNYVKQNDFNYCLIAYEDKVDMGVYAFDGWAEKDAGLTVDFAGDIVLGDSSNSIVYTEKEGKLVVKQ